MTGFPPIPAGWREGRPIPFSTLEIHEVAALEHETEIDPIGGGPARAVIYATGRFCLHPMRGPEVKVDALRWLLAKFDAWLAATGLTPS